MLMMARQLILAPLSGEDKHSRVKRSQGDGTLHPEERRFIYGLVPEEQEDRIQSDPSDEDQREEDDKSWTANSSSELIDDPLEHGRFPIVFLAHARNRLDRVLKVSRLS
jgi:hypothetical protein